MGGGGYKGKGKRKGKSLTRPVGPAKLKEEAALGEEVEVADDAEPPEDEEDFDPGTDEDFQALQVAVLRALSSLGKPVRAGGLGMAMATRRKPVEAALYALKNHGAVSLDGKHWSVSELAVEALGDDEIEVPARYLYDESKPRLPRPQTGDFERMKSLVQQKVASRGNAGATAGYVAYQLGANKKVVNACLYSLEKEGAARTLGPKAAGEKVRWTCTPISGPVSGEVPACYVYTNLALLSELAAEEAPLVPEPALKRQRVLPPRVTEGKGGAGAQQMHKASAPVEPVHLGASQPLATGGSPISLLNEWGQKQKRSVQFQDCGVEPAGGGFVCKVLVDGQVVASMSARNKKEAKTLAAGVAAQQLGLV